VDEAIRDGVVVEQGDVVGITFQCCMHATCRLVSKAQSSGCMFMRHVMRHPVRCVQAASKCHGANLGMSLMSFMSCMLL